MKKISIKLLFLVTLFMLSHSQECTFKDTLHSRSFSLMEFNGKYDKAIRGNLYMSLITKIEVQDIENLCKKSQYKTELDSELPDTYLIYQTDAKNKQCVFLQKSKIKLIKYNEDNDVLRIYHSENIEGEIFAYKFVIKQMEKKLLSDQLIQPSFSIKAKSAESPYTEIIYEIPYDSKGVKIRVKSFIFTSMTTTFFGIVSIPKLIFLIIICYSGFFLHLGMHEKHFPLHLILITFSWLYLFLIFASAIGIETSWINTVCLFLFLIIGIIILQFIKYETRKKIGYWLNYIIFFEFFCETVDISHNPFIVLSLEIFLILSLLFFGKLMLFLREENKIPKGVNFNEEVLVSALLAMKFVTYLARPIEPMRNPLYSLRLLGIQSTLPSNQEAVEIFLVLGFLLLFYFFLRMLLVFYKRRAKSARGEDYGSCNTEDYGLKYVDDSYDHNDTFDGGLDDTMRDTSSNLLKI